MNRHLAFSTVSSVLLLGGCMVGPKYVKPTVPMAPGFKEPPPESFKESDGWKPAQPGDQTLRGKWWEIFDDPQLNALEEELTVSNQNLKVAESRFRQARSMVRFNRSAEFPTISTSPSIVNKRESANQPYFPASLVNNGTGFLHPCLSHVVRKVTHVYLCGPALLRLGLPAEVETPRLRPNAIDEAAVQPIGGFAAEVFAKLRLILSRKTTEDTDPSGNIMCTCLVRHPALRVVVHRTERACQ
jgi:hypothetical protein